MKQSVTFRRRARQVEEFRDAYRDLLGFLATEDPWAPFRLVARKGDEEAAKRAEALASRKAGAAILAAKGFEPEVEAVQGRYVVDMPLTEAWRHTFEDDKKIGGTTDYVAALEQVIGTLNAKAEEAEAVERSLTGRVGRFVSFPTAVRAAVAEQHPELKKAAFATGVLAQVFVGVVVTVVGGIALAAVISLWGLLT